MNVNKITILKRLEAGEITASEALALMNDTSPTPDPKPQDPGRSAPFQNHPQNHPLYDHNEYHHHQESNWTDGIFNWVGEVVGEITSEIKDWDIGVNISDVVRGNYSHNKHTEYFTSKPITQSLAKLELHGKNDKIEIVG